MAARLLKVGMIQSRFAWLLPKGTSCHCCIYLDFWGDHGDSWKGESNSVFFSLGKSGDSANLGHNSGSFQLDAEEDATKLCWWLECFSVLSLETVEPTGLGCHITDRTSQRDNCSIHQLGFQAF